jgi:hypothetical protein
MTLVELARWVAHLELHGTAKTLASHDVLLRHLTVSVTGACPVAYAHGGVSARVRVDRVVRRRGSSTRDRKLQLRDDAGQRLVTGASNLAIYPIEDGSLVPNHTA